MNLLKGKNVIITGGSRGIGKGIAEKFAQNGANIVFTCIEMSDESIELSKNLEKLGVKAKAYESNAADFEAAQKLADDVINDFGSIDVLVNNAGITKDNLLMRMSEEDFDKVMKVNMNSVFNNTKAVLRPMLKQKYGSIINLSSVVGVKGNPGQSNYSASKAGIHSFTKSVAKEVATRNITVNVIAPGYISTATTDVLSDKVKNEVMSWIPMQRFGEPDEIAPIAAFLSREEARYITGEIIRVDGGMAI